MGFKRWLGLLLFGLGSICGANPASAQTVIGNIAGSTNNGLWNITDNGYIAAAGFTMGSTAQSLTAARLMVSVSSGGSPIVELRSNDAGNPGAVVASFTNPSLTTSPSLSTFTPSAPFTLAANTTYWLTFRRETPIQVNWWNSNPGVNPTGPYATAIGGTRFSHTGGAVWNTYTVTPTYEILGTPVADTPAVPEPASALLFLPALGVVGFLKRRRG